jgi:hypothetical protein
VNACAVPESNDYTDGARWWAAMNVVADWCGGKPYVGKEPNGIKPLRCDRWAHEGDWIVQLEDGTFKVFDEDGFIAAFEREPVSPARPL